MLLITGGQRHVLPSAREVRPSKKDAFSVTLAALLMSVRRWELHHAETPQEQLCGFRMFPGKLIRGNRKH